MGEKRVQITQFFRFLIREIGIFLAGKNEGARLKLGLQIVAAATGPAKKFWFFFRATLGRQSGGQKKKALLGLFRRPGPDQ